VQLGPPFGDAEPHLPHLDVRNADRLAVVAVAVRK
jgi:hypothetical protein